MNTQLDEEYFNKLYNKQFKGTNCLDRFKKKIVFQNCKKIFALSQNNPTFFSVGILNEYSNFYSHLHTVIALSNIRYNIRFLENIIDNLFLDCKNILIFHLVENYLNEIRKICLLDI